MSDPVDWEALDPNNIIITLDLERLGELAVDISRAILDHKGLETVSIRTEDGELTEDGIVIASAAWNSVRKMVDRREFTQSVQADLAALDTPERVTQESVPNHRPEFGL